MNKQTKKKYFLQLLIINIAIIAVVMISFLTLGKYESVTVNAMAVNVRTGPGIDFDVASQVKRGQKLVIIGEENQWYNVRINDQETGWVASWLVSSNKSSPATNLAAKVNTPDTKLREEANTESKELESLVKGTKVTVTSEENGWSKVTMQKKEGWIFSELLTLEKDEPEKETAPVSDKLFARQDDTKIRKEPTVESEIVATINYGQSVKFKENSGEWYQVETADGQTGYVANWVVNFSELNKANRETLTSIAEATIVLDPGHGGSDVGSQSNNERINEKVVTLATAQYVKKELEKLGANVILTRSSDVLVPLEKISSISNRARADVFISFHYDSTEISNEASGTTTYYYDKQDMPLGEALNAHLERDLPLDNRGVEYGDYQVLRDNERPAILLELGYMNNDYDVNTFKTKKFQRTVAKSIATALVEFFEK